MEWLFDWFGLVGRSVDRVVVIRDGVNICNWDNEREKKVEKRRLTGVLLFEGHN